MVENEDTRRGSKRQEQDIVSSRRTKKNKIYSAVFSDICCVCLGNYDDDAGTVSVTGGYMKTALIMKILV